MKAESQRPKEQEDAIETLNAAIRDTDLAEKASCIAPAKIVFGSAGTLLTLIRVRIPFLAKICSGFTYSQDATANEPDYVELGLLCTDICRALDQGTNGKKPDELSHSAHGAINQLTV